MKPETAFELSTARGNYLHRKDEIVRGSLVESAEASEELSLKERFETLAERIAEYAESQSDSVGVGKAKGRVSLPVVIKPSEGGHPQVSLRLQYVGTYSPDSDEDGFVNCYGDLVKSVQAEWIRGPEGVSVETRPNAYHDSELTEKFFGEVFAAETLWQHEYEVAMRAFEVAVGMVRVQNHAEERLTLLEQSVDAYETAWKMRWVDRLETLSVFGVEPYTEVALLDMHTPVAMVEAVQNNTMLAGTNPGAETRERYERRVYGRVLTSDEIELAIAKLAEAEGVLSGQVPRKLRGEVELLNDRRRTEVTTLEVGFSDAKRAELQTVREAIEEDGFLKRKKDIEAWLGTRLQALDNLRPIDVIALDDQYDKDTLMTLVSGQTATTSES